MAKWLKANGKVPQPAIGFSRFGTILSLIRFTTGP
jgi:hypothetical protein